MCPSLSIEAIGDPDRSASFHCIKLYGAGARQSAVGSICDPERCPAGLYCEIIPQEGRLLGAELGKCRLFGVFFGLLNTK
jgi:hypothetical protein